MSELVQRQSRREALYASAATPNAESSRPGEKATAAVLVAYGSTGGGTEEIARWIADELRSAGLEVRLAPAAEITDVAGYRALVLGSAIYAMGWHTDCREFTQRFSGQFAGRPAWLFSSGPVDTS